MPNWIKADLTGHAGAPASESSPYAYVTSFEAHPTARVVYRGGDSHIHELRLAPDGSWMKADLTNEGGVPNAEGRPDAYLTNFGSHQVARVLYRGQDTHVHEVRLEPGQSWKGADLTRLSGAAAAAGDPFGYVTSFDSHATARVVYRSRDEHVHELRLEAGGSWKGADLTALAGIPNAQTDPFAYVTEDNGRQTARVVYLGEDAHIHEVRLEADQSWKGADLTHQTRGADGEGNPAAYLTRFDGTSTARVVYRGRDAHIHELRLHPEQSWKAADLTHLAGGPDARSDPFGYLTASGAQTARVVYIGQDAHVHELRLESGGSWKKADLTSLAGGSAEGASNPFAYVTDFNNEHTPRVLYRAGGGHIEELRLA